MILNLKSRNSYLIWHSRFYTWIMNQVTKGILNQNITIKQIKLIVQKMLHIRMLRLCKSFWHRKRKKYQCSQSPAKYKWIFYFFSMQILELITLATSSGAGDQRNHTLINPLKLSHDLWIILLSRWIKYGWNLISCFRTV